ncbi:MAG: BTAD domain-containing putative transcriptional regulator [Pseudomonadota bacterium]
MQKVDTYLPPKRSSGPYLQVLGTVCLWDGAGRALRLSTRKSLWVLACLSARSGPWRREQLATLFWGDRQEEQARASLRKSLSEIRKALGGDAIETTHQDVLLCDGVLTTDLAQLRELAHQTAAADHGPLERYFAGDFMSEVDVREPSGWLDQMRTEARSLATTVTKISIEHLTQEKQFATALDRARDMMSMDPFSEANHRRLMRLYVLDGEVSKAAGQYQECKRLLRTELNVEPSAETRDLALQILSDADVETPTLDHAKDGRNRERSEALEGSSLDLDVPDIPSIAVLPFDNMSGDPEQEYFADGITEDIIAKLARLRWLFVIARNSTFVYKRQPVDVKLVGQELGVQYVVEGSTRRVGRRVRVTAQLVETRSGNHVWAQQFDRDFGDVFDVEDEVTDRICASIGVELSQSEQRLARRKPPGDHTAWEDYQCGMWHLHKYGQASLAKALSFFLRAVDKSPAFARAHAGVAQVMSAEVIMGLAQNPAERLATSLTHAQHAIELDDREDRGFTALGLIYGVMGDGEAAIAALERAIDINPCSAKAHSALGWALAWFGRADVAVAPLDRAFRLSPYDPLLWTFFLYRSSAYFFLEDYEKSLDDAQKAARIKGEEFWPHLAQAVSYQALGHDAQAQAACAQALSRDPDLSVSRVKTLIGTMHDAYAEPWFSAATAAGLPEA